MKKPPILKAMAILVMGAIIAVILILVYLNHDYQTEIVLDCKLPTERPVMDVPTLITPTFNNSTDALTYMARYLPEFDNSNPLIKYPVDEPHPGEYVFQNGSESVWVYPDGRFILLRTDASVTSVPEKKFPVKLARTCSTAFIESHGGLGSFEETDAGAGQDIDVHGTVGIINWNFDYHKRYDGYMVYGLDRIFTTVDPVGPAVSHYIHGDYQFGVPNETRQVIPAKEAWEAARNGPFLKSTGDIRITKIDLCYYIGQNANNMTVIYPIWRFHSSDIDIFVDAFTGIPVI